MSKRIDVNSDKYKLLSAIFKMKILWVQDYLLTAYGGKDLRVLADDKINGNPEWSVETKVINLRFYTCSKYSA